MKILFISHEATRTGAPFVLLYFLEWIKREHEEVIFDVLLIEGGDLVSEFSEVSNNCYNLSELSFVKRSTKDKIFDEIKRRFNYKIKKKDKKKKLIQKIANNNYDLIYANTIVSIPIATKIKELGLNSPKIVAHIHELNTVIKEYLPNFNNYVDEINIFISASKLVRDNLISEWNVNPALNNVIYEFSDKEVLIAENKKDYFEVGGSGNVHWRKGDDLFIQVANYIKSRYPEIKVKFTWVGKVSDAQKNILEADLEKANLKDIVFFVGEQKKPENYFKNFDLFLMTSREDPFPLVCIEVGKIGIPIICFEKATGTAEILINGGGFIVPYLDIVSMGEKVIYYYKNTIAKEKDGLVNREQFARFSSKIICNQLFELLESCK